MPNSFAKRLIPRPAAALALGIAAAACAATIAPSAASASSSQITIMQDGAEIGPSADATFQQFRQLGATAARVVIPWSQLAPDNRSFKRPQNFNGSNPSDYSNQSWAPYDDAVRAGQKYGIAIDFVVTGGAPQWAEAKLPHPTPWNAFFAFKPNASEYGKFMTAVAKRYSGSYPDPVIHGAALPRVHFWTIFNEPNFGQDLGPQALGGARVPYAPMLYRKILNAGWKALHGTGHGRDTILVGGYAARGMQGGRFPGNFAQTKPLLFIRFLYCLDLNYRQVRGRSARNMGCPTNASGSRRFRNQNPALFNASGVADHPYPDTGSPTNDGKRDPNFATFPNLGNFGRAIDKAVRKYRSGKRFQIYNDEYGYITRPPARRSPTGGLYPTPDKAATNINQAEFLSFKNGRMKSYMQYLLRDPSPSALTGSAGFASGLEFISGVKKADYFAFNLPVWMPTTSFSHRRKVEVWGDARPAVFERRFGPQSVAIQLQRKGQPFVTVNTVKVRSNGYFDIKMKFSASGAVRLTYTYPTGDPLLPATVKGSTVASRSFNIRVH